MLSTRKSYVVSSFCIYYMSHNIKRHIYTRVIFRCSIQAATHKTLRSQMGRVKPVGATVLRRRAPFEM